MRLLYTVLVYLLAPVALLATMWRSRRGHGVHERWQERFGFTRARFEQAPIWVHAVSVGEVQASAVLVRALQRRYPERPILVTTGTSTGAGRVAALFGDSVAHAYLPYDLPGAARRFLDRVHPLMGIIMETEIWPNLYRECGRRAIPIVLASARLSEKSVRRYGLLRRVTRAALERVRVAAQSPTDAERFRAIGAVHVEVVGNLKFDIEVPPDTVNAGRSWRAEWLAERPVWIAASTHEGEESAALAAHRIVCERFPNALLVLVPRHPQRFTAVADSLRERRVRFATRSRQEPVGPDTQVVLVDTLGELLMFYAAADVASVGGSLGPIGGHTLLEPAAVECPIIVGPYNFNAPDIARLFLDNAAAIEVADATALGEAVTRLLLDDEARVAMCARARAILEGNRGTLKRLLEIVQEAVG